MSFCKWDTHSHTSIFAITLEFILFSQLEIKLMDLVIFYKRIKIMPVDNQNYKFH